MVSRNQDLGSCVLIATGLSLPLDSKQMELELENCYYILK